MFLTLLRVGEVNLPPYNHCSSGGKSLKIGTDVPLHMAFPFFYP